ncbi:asparaginase [Lactobacillus rodentium]|uniref:asparaginase n=1 Tax=Lactobacillus rodentium TaxID=947835 RepID=A0A2Z6TUA0_9LACO|nr:asparaginase [Lactobacillus rodentium]MCR1894988.1 asparaginase [Lactobacillus rodentium]GBG05289.1 L-asparaginase [Lactobacillus rodentium]
MAEKRLLLLTTGGTIASEASDSGLVPRESGQSLVQRLEKLPYDIDVKDILQLDSSNIQPEEWQLIATEIYDNMDKYDGIVLSHGTDTMSYTASMLSFMIQNVKVPVVLTGSQVPINVVLSDAPDNLRLAFVAAATCEPAIYLAFDRKVMLGCRTVKVRTINFDAFESVNLPPIATVTSDGLVFNKTISLPKRNKKCQLKTNLETQVSLVKLFPGFDPNLLFAMVDAGCKGIVIEAYGLGGMNYIRRNLVAAIGKLIDQGIPVITSSQCLYERSDLTRYEVGRLALLEGAISAHDMTSESAITKLMWGLGQGMDVHQIARLFETDLVGEVTLE